MPEGTCVVILGSTDTLTKYKKVGGQKSRRTEVWNVRITKKEMFFISNRQIGEMIVYDIVHHQSCNCTRTSHFTLL